MLEIRVFDWSMSEVTCDWFGSEVAGDWFGSEVACDWFERAGVLVESVTRSRPRPGMFERLRIHREFCF